MADEYILKADNITVQFPGVKALDNVQLHIRKGTVHALMGENGAGKSTLMKCLIGINHPDEGGTILFKGENLKLSSPHDALSRGIAMIHQELSPIPEMTVTENIYLGRETMNGPFVNRKADIARTRALLERLNIRVSATEQMKNLSMANTQMVEIAKAISYDADLVIMDEPSIPDD